VYDKLLSDHGATGPINLTGNLLGANGVPIANATIAAESYFAETAGTTITGVNGTFAFSGISVGTDILRFKVSVRDNGTDYTSYSGFYPAENTSGMTVSMDGLSDWAAMRARSSSRALAASASASATLRTV